MLIKLSRSPILKIMIWFPHLKQEKIYIIDAADLPLRAVSAVAKDDKLFVQSYKESQSDELSGTILHPEALTDFLKDLKIANGARVIFIWNGASAVTYTAKVHLEKHRSNAPPSPLDIQRIYGTATLQFFNQFREEAKRRFRVDDLGLVLVSSRVLDLKLDGETYINPESVKAKQADVAIEQTFLRREMHEAINNALGPTCGVLHVEIGTSLYILSRLCGYKFDDALIVHAGFSQTHLYVTVADLPVPALPVSLLQYRGGLDWGTNNIYKALSDSLGIREEDADTIITKFISEGVSPRFTSLAKKVMQNACDEQLTLCKTQVPKSGGMLFFSQEPLTSFLNGLNLGERYSCLIPSDLYHKDIVQLGTRLSSKLSPRALSPVFFAGLVAYWSRLGDNYLGTSDYGNVKWMIPHNSI